MTMRAAPWSRRYSITPSTMDVWVVAPCSGGAATARLGLSTTSAPRGMAAAASAASSSARAMARPSAP